MGKELPASHYDAIYQKSAEYQKPWRSSRYALLWQKLIDGLDPKLDLLDLGCGPAQIVGLVKERGFKTYHGIDFSSKAFDMAVQNCLQLGLGYAPMHGNQISQGEFIVKSLHEDSIFCRLSVRDIISDLHEASERGSLCGWNILMSEFLEHIEKDIQLMQDLQRMAYDQPIAISVPTFDDPGHVRHFKTVEEAEARYGPYIDITTQGKIGPWIYITGNIKKP